MFTGALLSSSFRHLVPVLIVTTFLTTIAGAQRFHTQTYGLRDGLPTAHVADVIQDQDGLIWLATRAGVLRYDGVLWESHSPTNLLAGESFLRCVKDDAGRIWAATDAKVYVLEDETWRSLPAFGPPIPSEWDSIIDLLLVRIDGEIVPVVSIRSGRIQLFRDNRWQTFTVPGNDGAAPIRSVSSIADDLWVATEFGLYRLDPRHGTSERISSPIPSETIYCVCHDPQRNQLWFVGLNAVAMLSSDGKTFNGPARVQNLDLSIFSARWSPVHGFIDGDGGIYFGSSNSALHFSFAEGPENLQPSLGFVGTGLNGACLDREGNMWIASDRGLTKVISRHIRSFDREHGLFDDEVSAIAERPDGTILLGHNGGLTEIRGHSTRRIALTTNGVRGRVLALAVRRDGVVFAASEYAGIARISLDYGVTWLTTDLEFPISHIALDEKDVIHVTTNRGVFRLSEGRAIALLPPELMNKNEFAARLLQSDRGGWLIATSKRGLVQLHGDAISLSESAPEFRSTFTVCRQKDVIWVGTRNGLGVLRGNQVVLSENPEIRRPVYGLLAEPSGNLWIGTDDGLFVFDGTSVDHLNSERGLLGLEINRAALMKDQRGNVWAGTDRGVTVFRHPLRRPPGAAPTASFLGVEADGRFYSSDRPLVLDTGTRTLIFKFRGISFLNERELKFRVRLRGFDPEWSAPARSPLREIRYTSLPPGEYCFEIQPIDIQGQMGAVVCSPEIILPAPFFSRRWVQIVVTCLAALFILITFGLAFERRHARRLEAEIRQRTEELRVAERVQAQAARLDSLGVFAGGIAHDFNNLLTSIGGSLSLLSRDTSLQSSTREVVQEVENACIEARSLTRQLLTFSSGGEPLREPSSILPVLRESVILALRSSPIRIEFELGEDLPYVDIDRGQFHQVFVNLAVNARQAMPAGGVFRIRVRRVETFGDRPGLEVSIEDSGPGIPENILPRIFDPFFTTKSDGTGLGLAIVHSIVTRHGGEVRASSVPGEGTRFTIVLPASHSAPPAAPESITPAPVEGSSNKSEKLRRILVMDDEPSIRAFVRLAIKSMGHEVIDVSDGAQAVSEYQAALAQDRPFDVVLMDLVVPRGEGGVEATAKILALDPGARVIVTSGYSDDHTLADHRRHGFWDRLPKPYRLDDLAKVLERVFTGD